MTIDKTPYWDQDIVECLRVAADAIGPNSYYLRAAEYIEELRQENKALRDDAIRYRWIRSDARVGRWMVMQWLPHLGKYERVKEEKINDYIDSAMKLSRARSI